MSEIFERFPDFIQEYIYSHNWEALREVQVVGSAVTLTTDAKREDEAELSEPTAPIPAKTFSIEEIEF